MSVEFLSGLPQELVVVLVAATPVIELRGSIPLGVLAFGMSVPAAVLWSLAGNMLPLLFVYGAGNAWVAFCRRRQGILERLTDGVMERARRKLQGRYVRYGLLALAMFVAVPLPFTGAWTGLLAAFVFGISVRQVWPYILSGLVVSAAVVSLATVGAIAGAGFILK